MKYLVVSDNHGDRDVLVDIEKNWNNKVDAMFHCGDSELDSQDKLWQKYIVVNGNCDYSNEFPKETLTEMDNDLIYTTHGHFFNVNLSLDILKSNAQKNKATIALYGHTHKLDARVEDGILFVNPGSISQPRGSYKDLKTYVIISEDDGMTNVTYYNRDHHPIEELSFDF